MSSATELVRIEQAEAPSLQLNNATILTTMRSLSALRDFVAQQMIPGVDYGQIPGTGKNASKVLLQPGAQKTAMLYNCRPAFAHTIKELPNGHREVTVRCRLIHRGTRQIAAEGWGACSTLESKYRYRNDRRKCPVCGSQALIQTKGGRNPGGYWCPADKGGCGGNFAPRDQAIENQKTGKVENPDIADVYNTVLKMGDKRAFVAATINLGAMSELFTQDLDDDVLPTAKPTETEPPREPNPREHTKAMPTPRAQEDDSAQRKAEVNNSFTPANRPPKTDSVADFKKWMMNHIGAFNVDWQLIMVDHGVDEKTRRLSAEATNWNRAVNGLITQAIALNELDEGATLKDDNSGKRDPALSRRCAEWLLETKPEAAERCWQHYAADKLARLRRELGLPREPGDDDE